MTNKTEYKDPMMGALVREKYTEANIRYMGVTSSEHADLLVSLQEQANTNAIVINDLIRRYRELQAKVEEHNITTDELKILTLPVGFISTVNLKAFFEGHLSFRELYNRVVKYETITGDSGVDKYKR